MERVYFSLQICHMTPFYVLGIFGWYFKLFVYFWISQKGGRVLDLPKLLWALFILRGNCFIFFYRGTTGLLQVYCAWFSCSLLDFLCTNTVLKSGSFGGKVLFGCPNFIGGSPKFGQCPNLSIVYVCAPLGSISNFIQSNYCPFTAFICRSCKPCCKPPKDVVSIHNNNYCTIVHTAI